jgi:hypothetical protein
MVCILHSVTPRRRARARSPQRSCRTSARARGPASALRRRRWSVRGPAPSGAAAAAPSTAAASCTPSPKRSAGSGTSVSVPGGTSGGLSRGSDVAARWSGRTVFTAAAAAVTSAFSAGVARAARWLFFLLHCWSQCECCCVSADLMHDGRRHAIFCGVRFAQRSSVFSTKNATTLKRTSRAAGTAPGDEL